MCFPFTAAICGLGPRLITSILLVRALGVTAFLLEPGRISLLVTMYLLPQIPQLRTHWYHILVRIQNLSEIE